MNTEKRMILSYEILSSIKIGNKEIALAMDEKNTDGEKYLTCFIERDELFEHYEQCLLSDDYAEIVKVFGSRIENEAELHIESVKKLGIPISVITKDECVPEHYSYNINGKVIALDIKYLRPEFQRADRQLYFVNGGSGASANSRGSAVFCTNVYTGENTRVERQQIFGEVKPECVPEWAKSKVEALKKAHLKRDKEAAR